MSRKIINMPGARVSIHPTENAYRDRNHEIDYVTEEGKLVLDTFFSDGAFYIAKCIHGKRQDIPEDMIFQCYEELSDFFGQFQGGSLYDNNGRLYYSAVPNMELLYEIRRVSNKGEGYLALRSYETHQGIIDALWSGDGYTESPALYMGGERIRKMLFAGNGDDTVYANTPETYGVIESYAYKDNGHYTVSGRLRYYRGPAFDGEAGTVTEDSLENLFNGRTAIVKDCSQNRFLLMGDYSQMSELWKEAEYIEIRDEDGDLAIYCSEDRAKAYMVRTVTEAGMLYLDSHKPCPGLFDDIWSKELFAEKIYKE